ncbi:MAG: pseudouridine synthase [Betaproteobacteria bacterium]|nr:pseudouridine synthase [Betaproteobacteria bacterium]MBK8916910.1 pseudouridine synthase [Betaproteobacteria bacterium]
MEGAEGRPVGKKPALAPSPWKEAPAARPKRSEGPAPRPAPGQSSPPRDVQIIPPAVPGERPREGVRLSKIMAERGLCSRREADAWIERGWVFVDGQRTAELGTRIDPQAEISVSREAQKDQAKQVTILLNKPVGYVSGQPEPGCTPAVTLIDADSQVRTQGDPEFKPWMLRGLAPAGRLDSDSSGLLVFTQDGRVAKLLIGEDGKVEKEYLVRVSGQMVANGLSLLKHGLELDGKALKPARVKQLNEDQLHFILQEGKKRQIRRMCELVGLKVTGLKRVRIGRVMLGDLPPGKWRFLHEGERF